MIHSPTLAKTCWQKTVIPCFVADYAEAPPIGKQMRTIISKDMNSIIHTQSHMNSSPLISLQPTNYMHIHKALLIKSCIFEIETRHICDNWFNEMRKNSQFKTVGRVVAECMPIITSMEVEPWQDIEINITIDEWYPKFNNHN